MEFFPLFSAVLVIAALFSYLNHRFLRLPTTIGVMVISLVASILLVVLDHSGWDVRGPAVGYLEQLHFREFLLDCLLSFLLFAGALHVDLGQLLGQRFVILSLATVGVVLTTFLVGALSYLAFGALGFEVGFGPCLVFGALISPTDPIAVLGILKKVGVPKSLETKITGESLFNDGVGVVVFSVLLSIVAGGRDATVQGVAGYFAQEVLGSVVLGLVFGWIVYRLLRTVENYQVEVLLTLALAVGLYSLTMRLHSSGPLAVVVAGLWIGNSGRTLAMSPVTREHVDSFWELIDEILNVILFVLIGLELLVIDLSSSMLLAGVLAIPLVLAARFVSVGGTVTLLKRFRTFTPGAIRVMTWGGLRGGISIALALAIPPSVPGRDLILTTTYVIVIFSILVQGLTIGPLVRRVVGS